MTNRYQGKEKVTIIRICIEELRTKQLPPFMSNHEEERANPVKLGLGEEVVGSPGLALLPADFTDFVTCSIPIMERTRRPKLAMRGDGSLAKVHIASTHCEYIALSKGFGLE